MSLKIIPNLVFFFGGVGVGFLLVNIVGIEISKLKLNEDNKWVKRRKSREGRVVFI